MCLGIPTQIIEITDVENAQALIELGGVRREVGIALLLEELQPGEDIQALVGKWAVVHAGFAIGLVDEDEAEKTLQLISEWDQQL